jgi:type VI secretion system protein ImpA
VWVTKARLADWAFICETCVEILEKRSKDIRIAAWLTEALLHEKGLPGLAQGLYILHRLIERYWDSIHTASESNDDEAKTAPIIWLNQKLGDAIELIPLLKPAGNSDGEYHLRYFETHGFDSLLGLSRAPADEEESGDLPSPSAVLFETSPDFLAESIGCTENGIQLCGQIEKFYAARIPVEPPTLFRVRASLDQALQILDRFWTVRMPEKPAVEERAQNPSLPDPEPGVPSGRGRSAITTREQAYRALADAADFLERIEPHSPVPHLVRRAVGWGQLSLEEMLPQLIKNQADLNNAKELLGLGRK